MRRFVDEMKFASESMMPDQYAAISECLSGLADKLNVLAVLLVDGMGRVLAEKMIHASTVPNPNTLGALATGTYSASREMARIIGETDFQMVLLEGKETSCFIMAVTAEHFLTVVFSTKTALGMVRLFTKRSAEQIRQILSKRETRQEPSMFNSRFQSLLEERLDHVFSDAI
jgi:predicted regulator of Ras-like GTPase activity (Roadblock/LC7/MglB family)